MENETEKRTPPLFLRTAYYLSTLSTALLLIAAYFAGRPSGIGLSTGWLFLETSFFIFLSFQALALLLCGLSLITIFKRKSRGVGLFVLVTVSVALYSSLAIVFRNHIFGTM